MINLQMRNVALNDAARTAALSLIKQIADRAVAVYAAHGVKFPYVTVLMDLTACHFGARRLRLDDMLAADDFNLMHDVGGINRNLNHDTLKLDNGFTPRFAVQAVRQ